MYKISIIIPVYNVEKYILKTIESVINQTYYNTEIILVDDGSTDNSSKICDEFSKRDNRICVIHQENQGLSAARNIGTNLATGDFVFYLDGDDYLENDALENLIALSDNCDLVIGNYYYTYSDHEDVADSQYLDKSVLNTDEAMYDLLIGKIQNFAWGKLIKSSIAKKQKFPEGKLFEDTYWAHLIVNDSTSVCVTNIPLLHYRQRDNSISYTIDIKRLDVLEGWSNRADFVKNNYPEYYRDYMCFITYSILSLAWLTLTKMKNDKKKAFFMIRDFVKKNHLAEYSQEHNRILIKSLEKSSVLYSIVALVNKLLH